MQTCPEKNHLAYIRARQAFCHLRLGGLKNLLKSAALYEESLAFKSMDICHLWRLQAGRVYKRLAHPNLLKKGQQMDYSLKLRREKTAMDYFESVSKESSNPRLRAFAFSDLACMASFKLKKNLRGETQQLHLLCDKALANNCKYPYVLLNCGKSLIKTNISRALKLLTEASDLGPSSHILFQLASCFQTMSYRERRKSTSAVFYLNEAEKSYRRAIDLASSNLPARYSLAKLLYDQGKVKEAKIEFTQIITTVITCEDQCYAQTVMKAYERVALCLLELSQDQDYVANLPSSMTESSVRNEAETMLIQALEMGFSLLTREEIKHYLGNSLESLRVISANKPGIPEALQLIARVFHLAKEPLRSLHALDQLLAYVTPKDPDTMASIVKSYQDLQSFERAYALLQVSSSLCGMDCFDETLQLRVSLSAAQARLQYGNVHAARIFKSQFDHHRQQRISELESDSAAGGQSPIESSSDLIAEETEQLDVLIFYDDSKDGSNGPSTLGRICRKLQYSMSAIFGLNVCCNLQRCCAGGPQIDHQCEEMTRAEVVLVVIGAGAMDNYFKQLLHFLPTISLKSEDIPRPPRILIAPTEDGLKFPFPLSLFPKTPLIERFLASLQTVVDLCLAKKSNVYISPAKDVSEDIRKSVEDIMSFFCCLISTTWPLPDDPATKTVKRS